MSNHILRHGIIWAALVVVMLTTLLSYTLAQDATGTPATDPETTGKLVVVPGLVEVGQTTLAVGFHVVPSDLEVKIEYSEHFVLEGESCGAGSPGATTGAVAPTWVTLKACSVGKGWVRLVTANTGSVIQEVSVTVSQASGQRRQSAPTVTLRSVPSSLTKGASDGFNVRVTGLDSGEEYELTTVPLTLNKVAFNSGCTDFEETEEIENLSAKTFNYTLYGCGLFGSLLWSYLNDADGNSVANSGISQHLITVKATVTIQADQTRVTEGEDIEFTVTSDLAPSGSSLSVDVEVTEQGSYISGTPPTSIAIRSGQRSASFTVQTDNDSVDERHGSVTGRIEDGGSDAEYVAGSPSSDTVTVRDNDYSPPPPPRPTPTPRPLPTITIALYNPTPSDIIEGDDIIEDDDITEGQNVLLTLTASRVLAADLTVNVSVTETPEGAFLTGDIPTQITIARGSLTRDLILQTVNDDVDEANGTIEAEVLQGDSYNVGRPDSASVTVEDNDKPAKPSNFRINGHLEDGEVTMRWDTNPEANEYQVQYQELDCTEGAPACDTVGDWVMNTGNTSGIGSAKEATLGGLSRFTVYQVQVKAVAVDASDEWSDITLVWPTSETVTVFGTSVASTPLHNYVADGTYTYQLCNPIVEPQTILDPVPVPEWFDADAVFRASQEWQDRVVWSLGAAGNIIKIINNGTTSDCSGRLGNRHINLVMFLSPEGTNRFCGDNIRGCISVDPGNMDRPPNWTTIVLRADEAVMTESNGNCIEGYVTAVHEFGHGVGGVFHNSLGESIMSPHRRHDLCAPTIYDEVPIMGNYQSR